jgi:hypothetical protein
MEFKFRPVSHSWVALHPNPKGVVQFIGGAFFGTFPTIFYRYFLSKLFAEGYTIIALPFRFSFRHWPIAVSLIQEQAILIEELSQIAENLNYQNQIYQDKTKYFWIGHSLGCKYITLLEFLSGDASENIVEECIDKSERQLQAIQKSVECMLAEKPSIKGQPSLLIAPDISDTESAIPQPLAFIARFLDKVGLGVLPTRKQTQCLVENSNLFNLTALISFDQDNIAGSEKDTDIQKSDVIWFIRQLQNKRFTLLHKEIQGKHLEPVGIKVGSYIVDLNPLDKFIEPIYSRQLESLTIQFLDELKKRQQSSNVDSEPSLVSVN